MVRQLVGPRQIFFLEGDAFLRTVCCVSGWCSDLLDDIVGEKWCLRLFFLHVESSSSLSFSSLMIHQNWGKNAWMTGLMKLGSILREHLGWMVWKGIYISVILLVSQGTWDHSSFGWIQSIEETEKKKQFRTGGSRNRIAMDFVKIEEQLNGNSLIHSIFFCVPASDFGSNHRSLNKKMCEWIEPSSRLEW